MDSLNVIVNNLVERIDSLEIISSNSTQNVWGIIFNIMPLIIAFFAVLYGPRLSRRSSKEQLENIKEIEKNKYELEKEKLIFEIEKIKAELSLKIDSNWLKEFIELSSDLMSFLLIAQNNPNKSLNYEQTEKLAKKGYKFLVLLDFTQNEQRKMYKRYNELTNMLVAKKTISDSKEFTDFIFLCQMIINEKKKEMKSFRIKEKKLSEKLENINKSISDPKKNEENYKIAKKYVTNPELRKQVMNKIKKLENNIKGSEDKKD